MAKDPLVSISIPTYNSAAFLERCLAAVAKQTYSNIQVHLIDGYSKDDTLEIAKRFNVPIFLDKEGLLNARKLGIENAEGEMVLLLDSDQILELDAVERAVKYLNEKQLDMLVLEEDVYRNKTLLERLFHLDRKLIHAVRDFSPYTGVMLPRFYRRDILLRAFANIPAEVLKAGGQDHAVIYYEAWQLSQSVDLLSRAVRHIEPSTFREIIPKFYRWGYTSQSARTPRYKDMLEKKERFRKGIFKRGLVVASLGSIALLVVKGVPYYIGKRLGPGPKGGMD